MKNLLLFMVSVLLIMIFTTVSILISSVLIITGIASSRYYFETALQVDVIGNVMGQYIWNFIFIKSVGYKFGVRGETMSSVLGKNQRDNTLKFLGKQLVAILNLIEKDHCLKSII